MEYVIEIGNESEKKLIEKELSFFGDFIERLNKSIHPPINLNQIIVASNFESKINQLENRDDYKAVRGMDSGNIAAMAKIAQLNDGFAIVLSPIVYTEKHDSKTRSYVVMHELSHIINKRRFPSTPAVPTASDLYVHNLYYLYDEYYSDRFAFEVTDVIFKTPSNWWDEFETINKIGLIEVINDARYYDFLRSEIESFRYHADIELFLRNVQPSISDVAVCISHLFAWFHTYPVQAPDSDGIKSPFLNQKTLDLMGYYKDKYEKKEFDLADGNNLIIDFMTNFGVRYEHREQGLVYCHVLDI